jgi:ribonuclease HII
MILPSKKLERVLMTKGYDSVIGIDEVGMGPIAGPVTVCAITIHRDFYYKPNKSLQKLRDSKQLLQHQREKYYKELIRNKHVKYALYSCSVQLIDKLGILQASHHAMRKALQKIGIKKKCFVLVDGAKEIERIGIPQRAIIKGDQKIFVIACASIMAKVHRDKLMLRYAKKFPGYGFEQHMGYPTKLHKQKMRDMGPCILHRKNFRVK